MTSPPVYPIGDQIRARELRAAGWSLERICDLIEKERGRRPSKKTIWMWTHPKKAREQALASRARCRQRRAALATFAWPGFRGKEWKSGRMRALADAGLSDAAVAKVMTVDFPDEPISRSQVEYALRTGSVPLVYRRVDHKAAA